MLPFEAVRLVKPTSLIRDADLSLRIAGLPVYMPDEGSAKQNLGDPPANIVQVIIGPARQKWDIPRSTPGDIYFSVFIYNNNIFDIIKNS